MEAAWAVHLPTAKRRKNFHMVADIAFGKESIDISRQKILKYLTCLVPP